MDVRTESHPDEECRALAGILIRIGDKRTVMVVRALSRGSMRYSEIFKLVDGVSQRMLTLTLKSLEREGLVHSDNVPDDPASGGLCADRTRTNADRAIAWALDLA